jgi:hypothetical protein
LGSQVLEQRHLGVGIGDLDLRHRGGGDAQRG